MINPARPQQFQRLSSIVLEDQDGLTLVDLCRACAVHVDVVTALVDEGVLTPSGITAEHWRFTGVHLHRARVAVRLQRDLGVNMAGAALAIELLEELENLKAVVHKLAAAPGSFHN